MISNILNKFSQINTIGLNVKYILTILLIQTWCIFAFTQTPPYIPCNNNNGVPSCNCNTAPLLCNINDLQGYNFTMGNSGTPPTGPSSGDLCVGLTNTAWQNPHWLRFIALCEDFTVNLAFSNCTGSGPSRGIQTAIYAECNNVPSAIACDAEFEPWPACQNSPNPPCFGCGVSSGSRTLDVTGAEIGKIYYLVIDGCGGSRCDISFSINSGACNQGIGTWTGPITGEVNACVGQAFTYVSPTVSGGLIYEWKINNSLVFSETIVDGQTEVSYNHVWTSPGNYTLCVDTKNICSSADENPPPNCIDIIVHQADAGNSITVSPVFTCPKDTLKIKVGGNPNLNIEYSQYILIANSKRKLVAVIPDTIAYFSWPKCEKFTAYTYNYVSDLINPPVVGDSIPLIINNCNSLPNCCEIISVPFIIVDTLPPVVVNPPSDITIQCLTELPPLSELTFSDNCNGLTKEKGNENIFIDGCNGGIIERSWEVYDSCGSAAIHFQKITVLPIPLATFVSAEDITVSCEMYNENILNTPLIYDNGLLNDCRIFGTIIPTQDYDTINGDVIVTLNWFSDQNNCSQIISDTQKITIKKSTTLNAPFVYCAGGTSSSVSFSWDDVLGATSYNVIITDPPNISGIKVPGQNRYEVMGLALGQSVTIIVTAVIPGPCGNVTSLPLTCTTQDCGILPTVTVNNIPDICLPGSPIPLDASLVTVTPPIPNSTGSFTVNGNPATVFDPAILGAGTHTIRYLLTWDNNRCSQSGTETVQITVTPSSDFTVGPGGCVLDPVTVSYTGGTTGAVHTWNFGPDVIGTYNGAGPYNVRWTNPGQKTITLTVSKDGCTSTVTIRTVTVNPVLAIPTVSCTDRRIDGVTFGWTPVANASGYDIRVEIVGGAVLFSGVVNNTSYEASPVAEGTDVRITVTAISNNGCPNSSSTVVCKAASCPNGIISFPAKVITECLTSSLAPLPLTFTIKDNLAGEVPTVLWNSSSPITNAAINNNTSPPTFNAQTAGVGNHIIVLSYKQRLCEWKDSILVSLRPVPQASFTSKDKICVDDQLLVTYTGTNTGGRVLTWDDGGASRLDLTNTSVSYTFPQPGTYTIGVTTSLNGCTSTKFTKSIVVEAISAAPVITCSSTKVDGVTFGWTSIPNTSRYDIAVEIVGGAVLFSGTTTETSYAVPGLTEGTQVRITVAAMSTNGCPNTTATLICKAQSCPDARLSIPERQITACLTPDIAPIPLTFSIANNISNETPTITWFSSSLKTNAAIKNSTNPPVFVPLEAGAGTHFIELKYEQKGCIWSDSMLIKLNLPDDVLLKNDTVYVKPNVPVTLNVTDNDILPAEPFTIKAKEISSETITVTNFDDQGNITLQVNDEINEDERITYEVCDDCNQCYEGILVIINEDFKNFIPVTLITPDASSNKTLQFTKLPVKDSKLWIYNRWGQEIYYKEGYENDWNADGYPGGVYYYILEIYGVKIKKTLTVVK